MKKLRTTLYAIVLMMIAMPLFHSCLDDWDKNDYPSLSIGTVRIIDGKDYFFDLDEGKKMYPGDTTNIHNYTVTDGQRAFISFYLLDQPVTGYDYNAQVMHIENILTKDIYHMPAEKADSIGDDRINVTDVWFKGDYVNIQYQLYHSNSTDKKHMLNLVVNESSDGKNDREGYLTLEFRHNAYDDSPRELGKGIVSFKLHRISDLLKDKKGLNIRYRSLYEGERFVTVDK